jgi:replicative DNA helicase
VEQFDKFSGGLIAPEFGVIAATTGTGKTVGLVDFALYSWLTGHNTLLITGEMDKVDLQFRMDMYLTEISGMKFRKGELEPEDFVKWDATVKQYKATHGDALLHVVSFTRGFTRDHIEDVIIRLQDSTGKQIKWLGIDYLNIMQPTNYSGDDMDWGAQANVVWDVKSLTQEYDLVTWTANQVKDEAFEKELFELSDLKYARAISEAAPVVVAFVRSDTDILAGRMKMQVMKMRNAVVPAKPFILHPDMSIMKINKPQPTGSKSLDDVGKAEKTRMVRKHKHTIAAKDTRRKTT